MNFRSGIFLSCLFAQCSLGQIVIPPIPTVPLEPLVPAVPSYQVTDLGVLPGQASSIAIDINKNNVVVGLSGTRSFRFDCSMADLGSLGGSQTVVEDIHDNGSIVGFSRNVQGVKRPFIIAGGVMIDVGDHLIGEANAVGSWNIPGGRRHCGRVTPGQRGFLHQQRNLWHAASSGQRDSNHVR